MLDVRHWNAVFLEYYAEHKKPFRQRQKYDIKIRQAEVEPGQEYWACVGVKHLTGAENRGNHHVYCDGLDANGTRLMMTRVAMRQGNQRPVHAVIDKPTNEAGTNFPIWNGDVPCEVSVADGAPSDVVTGIRTNHPDEGRFNTIGHHSYYVVWKKVVAEGGDIDPNPDPDPEPDHDKPKPKPGDIEQVHNLTFDINGHQCDVVIVIRMKPKE